MGIVFQASLTGGGMAVSQVRERMEKDGTSPNELVLMHHLVSGSTASSMFSCERHCCPGRLPGFCAGNEAKLMLMLKLELLLLYPVPGATETLAPSNFVRRPWRACLRAA